MAVANGLGRGRGRGIALLLLRQHGDRGRRKGAPLRWQATVLAAGEDAARPNAKHGLGATTAREVVARVAMQGVVACAVFVGEVNALAVAVLTCRRWLRRRGRVGDCRAMAAREMLPLTVALRDVFMT